MILRKPKIRTADDDLRNYLVCKENLGEGLGKRDKAIQAILTGKYVNYAKIYDPIFLRQCQEYIKSPKFNKNAPFYIRTVSKLEHFVRTAYTKLRRYFWTSVSEYARKKLSNI